MKRLKYWCRISVEVEFNLQEARALQELAASHYDGHCQQAGQCGGFIFGMVNVATWAAPAPATYNIDASDIGTLRKILEPWRPKPDNNEAVKQIVDLMLTLGRLSAERQTVENDVMATLEKL